MPVFTELLLSQLTKSLTSSLVGASGRRLRRALEDPERAQALERCSEAGIVALISATPVSGEEESHLSDVVREFFTSADIAEDLGRALAPVLKGHGLDLAEMKELFVEAGYDPETLPGFDFETAFTAFTGGFAAAAVEQPTLRGEIEAHVLLTQLKLQMEMRDSLRQMAQDLAQAKPGTAAINAGQITAETVAGTQIIINSSAIQGPVREDWEPHYLRTLIHQCDPLDLSPIDETHPGGSHLDAETVRLSDVFTSLLLEGVERLPSENVAEALAGRRDEKRLQRPPGGIEGGGLQEADEKEKPLPIAALAAAAALPRLVVLGRPGGGKSTLVNHLATQLAKRRLGRPAEDDKLPGWPPALKPLPVRVVLRHFASWLRETATADAGLVWEYLEHQLERCGCGGAFEGLRETLKKDGCVVFFDGLDEVHEDDARRKRSLLRHSIEEFAQPLERCRVIVTCREYAYQRDDAWRLPESEFPAVMLAPFGLEQVRAFTSTWYRVIGPGKGWDAERCVREASQLAQAVESWPHLRSLAESPLLLTLMAQIHGRDGYLPRDRADLYERTVNLLLAQWENRLVRDLRGGSTVEPDRVLSLDLRTEVLRSALERVAFEAHERQETQRSEGAADVPADDLLHALDDHLGSLDKAREVIVYLQQRAGLLQAVDRKTYRFPHRTFQEYLAAKYLLKQPEYDEMLRDRVRRDLAWWREVFLLAAGASRETPRMISDLVDQLIPRGPADTAVSPQEAKQAWLAAQALEETRFVERVEKEQEAQSGRFTATCERVRAWLRGGMHAVDRLEPVERARCGQALDGLGRLPAEFAALEAMRFCRVPAGPFWMGDGKKAHLNEHLDYDYWIARYPVTVAQFRQYTSASGVTIGDPDVLEGSDNTPAVWVSWHEARQFCEWLSDEWSRKRRIPEGWRIRLPSEAEWEKAARGGIEILASPVVRGAKEIVAGRDLQDPSITNPDPKRAYPWKGRFDQNKCNSTESRIHNVSTVGCFPNGVTRCGCEEMSGNVWEWTRSKYQDYPYDPADGREKETDIDAARWVLRGGSFDFGRSYARCAARLNLGPANRGGDVGFRVVFSPFFTL